VGRFLRPLMPRKGKAELYTAIGLQKFGKAEFYRDFLKHLRYSQRRLRPGPGIPGMVMCVFTLHPSLCLQGHQGPLRTAQGGHPRGGQGQVQLVKLHDRVGRMADSWEYSHVAFPLERFAPDLLAALQRDCAGTLEHDGSELIVKHLYIERRMTPLNLYLGTADDASSRTPSANTVMPSGSGRSEYLPGTCCSRTSASPARAGWSSTTTTNCAT